MQRRASNAAQAGLAMAGLALLSGCGDGSKLSVCIGNADFCQRALVTNQPPEADAGADSRVSPGTQVVLDGSRSTDRDGTISSYSWAQSAGIGVALSNADQARAEFEAPATQQVEALTFQLTVVDNDNAAGRDEVTVTVDPLAAAARTGVELLTRAVAPRPVQTQAPCPGIRAVTGSAWQAYTGLWLSAQIGALQRSHDPERAAWVLDAARVLLAEAENAAPPEAPASAFWLQGLDALRRFATERDPALASAVSRFALPVTPFIETLRRDFEAGRSRVSLAEPGTLLVVPVAPAAALAAATRRLQHADCSTGTDPIAVAADTVQALRP